KIMRRILYSKTNTSILPNVYSLYKKTATHNIHTLSLHDALPISSRSAPASRWLCCPDPRQPGDDRPAESTRRHGPGRAERRTTRDRKSTRLNSSHVSISYAVFCLKKKIIHFFVEILKDSTSSFHR